MYAGRLSPEKGAADAIDLSGTAGTPIDASDPDYARTQIDPRRAQRDVMVLQTVPRASLWEAMAHAAVVLCPVGWDEPFGMAAAEAQACGTPVVAYRRGGLTEVIVDGMTGFLMPPGDFRAAVDAVKKATGTSRAACSNHAEERLDLDRALDAHEEVYRQMTASDHRAANNA